MARVQKAVWLTAEFADFLASCPSRKELLSYHPSDKVQERARELLQKSKEGTISADEKWELDQFEHAGMLLQLVKARLRAKSNRKNRNHE